MDAFLDAVGGSPWLFPALFALVVGDAFLVVLPSETVVAGRAARASAPPSHAPATPCSSGRRC